MPRSSNPIVNGFGGELKSGAPTFRERMIDALRTTLFTDDRAGQHRAEFLGKVLDFTPIGAGVAVADALRENDPAMAGLAMAVPPPVRRALGPIAGKMLRAKPNAFASRSYFMYNPPAKPPRPFDADYPQGAPADADTGRLLADIEGRPLVAERNVGRRVVGGGDEPFPQESLAALVEAATGRGPQTVPAGDRQIRGGAGALVRDLRLNKYDILLNRNVPERNALRVLAHEVGHLIDEMAGEIPTEGLSRELDQVYNTLLSGRERATNLSRPRHFGYTSKQAPRELMAEAASSYRSSFVIPAQAGIQLQAGPRLPPG
jgi:hypothetical protein